jgi:hypothetical protein
MEANLSDRCPARAENIHLIGHDVTLPNLRRSRHNGEGLHVQKWPPPVQLGISTAIEIEREVPGFRVGISEGVIVIRASGSNAPSSARTAPADNWMGPIGDVPTFRTPMVASRSAPSSRDAVENSIASVSSGSVASEQE